ncbi:MAG: hypothetical protein IJI09_07225, partial [Clostridia bacterium]|nr:hypothetical protein [Clostridia bacterium]
MIISFLLANEWIEWTRGTVLLDHFSLPVRLFVAFWSKKTVHRVHSIHSFANRKEIIIHPNPI